MPRWRALSDELDPHVREFVEQLRRIVERNGMSVGAVADRTGYSKTSWERYLNGRLLPPRGATEALADATGTDVGHLLTIWELAERAWSRSELRHDVTMEGIRVEEARAALAEYAPPPPGKGRRGWTLRRARGSEDPAAPAAAPEPVPAPVPEPGPAHVPEPDPAHVPAPEPEPDPAPEPRTGLPSARTAGVDARAQAVPLTGPPDRPSADRRSGTRPRTRPRTHPRTHPRPKRRAALLFTVGAVGALLMVVGAVLLLGYGPGGGARQPAPQAAERNTGSPAALPDGVKCAGGACTGKDPETMGCGGQRATTAGSTTVGSTYVEVRYSETCKAAWARMTQGGPGDTLRVSAASRTGEGRIERGTDGHSTMVAVAAPGEARACVVLSSGRQGCTAPRKAGTDGTPGASGVTGASEALDTSGKRGATGSPGTAGASEASQEVP
ncbi:helix-turn-helix domain-containing protein [Streptomyces huiliensis]|uniref:helix-turn-helix domain-containing protein n=1 Tax=Streptomyces huiliensis TaxID=2876027 RepID=UPI001CBD4F78|nr:XRE family transcriptional regulator [Streptomyces huiliensis]MBZ4320853.1 XRE family transcriptional regulator [Streptomyces huiliensis]